MTAFTLFIESLERFSEPIDVRDNLSDPITQYRFHISLFDPETKQWLNDTYESPLHEPYQTQSGIWDCDFQDLFHVVIEDSRRVDVILELTFVAYDQLNRIVREIGLGWTTIPLSKDVQDISSYLKRSLNDQMTTLQLFRGSPRVLMFPDSASSSGYQEPLEETEIRYCLLSHKNLSKYSSLIPKYTIFDERNGSESIVGLIPPHIRVVVKDTLEEELYSLRESLKTLLPPQLTGISEEVGSEHDSQKEDEESEDEKTKKKTKTKVSPLQKERAKFLKTLSKQQKQWLTQLESRISIVERLINEKEDADIVDRNALYESLLKAGKRRPSPKKTQKKTKSSPKKTKTSKKKEKPKQKSKSKQKKKRDEDEEESEESTKDDEENSDESEEESESTESSSKSSEEEESSAQSSETASSESSDEETDSEEIDDDITRSKFVPPLGTKSWLDSHTWDLSKEVGVLKDTLAKPNKPFVLDEKLSGMDLRYQMIFSFHKRYRFPALYHTTRSIALQRAWFFGSQLLNPLPQETIPINLENFKVLVPSELERVLEQQLDYVRMKEQFLETDTRHVSIKNRKLIVLPHNTQTIIGTERLERELVASKTMNVKKGKGAKGVQFTAYNLPPKQPPLILHTCYPHPLFTVVFILEFTLEVPVNVLSDDPADSVKEFRAKLKTLKKKVPDTFNSNFSNPPGNVIEKKVWIGWKTWRPFEVKKFSSSKGSGASGGDGEEKEVSPTMKSLKEQTILVCPQLNKRSVHGKTSDAKPTLTETRLEVSRNPFIVNFLGGLEFEWIFNATRGLLGDVHAPAPRPLRLQQHQTKKQGKTLASFGTNLIEMMDTTGRDANELLFLYNRATDPLPPPTVATNILSKSESKGRTDYAPEHELVFPFTQISRYQHRPFYNFGPHSTPPSFPASASQINTSVSTPVITFNLFIAPQRMPEGKKGALRSKDKKKTEKKPVERWTVRDSALEDVAFPVYVEPPWAIKRKKIVLPTEDKESETESESSKSSSSSSSSEQPRADTPPPPVLEEVAKPKNVQMALPTALPTPILRTMRIDEQDDKLSSQFVFEFKSFKQDGLSSPDHKAVQLPSQPFFSFRFYLLPRCWTGIGETKGLESTLPLDDVPEPLVTKKGKNVDDKKKKKGEPDPSAKKPKRSMSWSYSEQGDGELIGPDSKKVARFEPTSEFLADERRKKMKENNEYEIVGMNDQPVSTTLHTPPHILAQYPKITRPDDILPFFLEGSAALSSVNTAITLPEYLESHFCQIDVYDSANGLLFGSGFLPLSELVPAVLDNTSATIESEIPLWSSIQPETNRSVSILNQNQTFSPAFICHSQPPPHRHLAKLKVAVSHSRIRSPLLTYQTDQLIRFLLLRTETEKRLDMYVNPSTFQQRRFYRNSNAFNPQTVMSTTSSSRTGAFLGDLTQKNIVAVRTIQPSFYDDPLGDGGSMGMMKTIMGRSVHADKTRKSKTVTIAGQGDVTGRGNRRSLEDYIDKRGTQSNEIRSEIESKKRRMLYSLFLENNSRTRVIYPSFGSAVYFEVPIQIPKTLSELEAGETDEGGEELIVTVKLLEEGEESLQDKKAAKEANSKLQKELLLLNMEESDSFRNVFVTKGRGKLSDTTSPFATPLFIATDHTANQTNIIPMFDKPDDEQELHHPSLHMPLLNTTSIQSSAPILQFRSNQIYTKFKVKRGHYAALPFIFQSFDSGEELGSKQGTSRPLRTAQRVQTRRPPVLRSISAVPQSTTSTQPKDYALQTQFMSSYGQTSYNDNDRFVGGEGGDSDMRRSQQFDGYSVSTMNPRRSMEITQNMSSFGVSAPPREVRLDVPSHDEQLIITPPIVPPSACIFSSTEHMNRDGIVVTSLPVGQSYPLSYSSLSTPIEPRVAEIAITSASTGQHLSLSHIVICPLPHHVDRSFRVIIGDPPNRDKSSQDPDDKDSGSTFKLTLQLPRTSYSTESQNSYDNDTEVYDPPFVKKVVMCSNQANLSGDSVLYQHASSDNAESVHVSTIVLSQIIEMTLPRPSALRSNDGSPPLPYRFTLALFNDEYGASLFEIWEVVVEPVMLISLPQSSSDLFVGTPSKVSTVSKFVNRPIIQTAPLSSHQVYHVSQGGGSSSASAMKGAQSSLSFEVTPLVPGKSASLVSCVSGVDSSLSSVWLLGGNADVNSKPIRYSLTVGLNLFETEGKGTDLKQLEIPLVLKHRPKNRKTPTFILSTNKPNNLFIHHRTMKSSDEMAIPFSFIFTQANPELFSQTSRFYIFMTPSLHDKSVSAEFVEIEVSWTDTQPGDVPVLIPNEASKEGKKKGGKK
ncbi:putative serine/arginine repetitive matrix protein 2 [Blattamonas nauphoetae]|uniref:Serine/arginine repetitive matrix protein 2 n=1 Tax=Blattamonas nauphoetae TaxID=2049346 RepID=A0ABQ9Y4S9_9EUKA|nr:putative serine/arginine repetitive matrix protein 2 [Blattamonas nauphoetae]